MGFCQDLSDLEQAKEYQHRALKITLDKLGPEHVHVATSDVKVPNFTLVVEDGNTRQQLSFLFLNFDTVL